MILVNIGVMVCFGAAVILEGQNLSKGIPFFYIYSLLILYKAVTLLGGASDIVVDDEGISRRLYGWVWKRMRWDNIARIKAFEVYVEAQRIRSMAYNIFPIVKDQIRLLPSGKIAFLGTVDGITELLEVINKRADQYHILIQIKKNGTVTTASQLDISAAPTPRSSPASS